jgi:hypothetical protein
VLAAFDFVSQLLRQPDLSRQVVFRRLRLPPRDSRIDRIAQMVKIGAGQSPFVPLSGTQRLSVRNLAGFQRHGADAGSQTQSNDAANARFLDVMIVIFKLLQQPQE